MSSRRQLGRVLTALAFAASSVAHAEMSTEELAKLAQNPVGNLVGVPFQYNANLNAQVQFMFPK